MAQPPTHSTRRLHGAPVVQLRHGPENAQRRRHQQDPSDPGPRQQRAQLHLLVEVVVHLDALDALDALGEPFAVLPFIRLVDLIKLKKVLFEKSVRLI